MPNTTTAVFANTADPDEMALKVCSHNIVSLFRLNFSAPFIPFTMQSYLLLITPELWQLKMIMQFKLLETQVLIASFSGIRHTVMTLSFWTDRSGQTVQTQIRLLLESSLIRVFTVCYSICII